MQKKLFIFIFVLGLIFIPLTLALAQPTSLQKSADAVPSVDLPELQIKIGQFGTTFDFKSGLNTASCTQSPTGMCLEIGWIGQYISAVYQYGIGIAAVLAVIMIMAGGFLWLTSAGSPDRVGKAKDYISSALLGLFLALFSFVILYTLNPRLVELDPVRVPLVPTQVASTFIPTYSLLPGNGCCVAQVGNYTTCWTTSQGGCDNSVGQNPGTTSATIETAEFYEGVLCSQLNDQCSLQICQGPSQTPTQNDFAPCGSGGDYCFEGECLRNQCNERARALVQGVGTPSQERHNFGVASQSTNSDTACDNYCGRFLLDGGLLNLNPVNISFDGIYCAVENFACQRALGCCLCQAEWDFLGNSQN